MAEEIKQKDPTLNVREMIEESSGRLDDLRKSEVVRINEKIDANDVKYQVQFNAAKEAVGIALVSSDTKYQIQFADSKEAVITALATTKEAMIKAEMGTKEAIVKNDANTDKRFDLLSEKIDGVIETISKSSGTEGNYVTHVDLSNEMSRLRADFEIMLRPVVNFMQSQTGQQKGISSSWAVLLGGVGLISTMLGIFLILSRFI